jgi:hypothetical protein
MKLAPSPVFFGRYALALALAAAVGCAPGSEGSSPVGTGGAAGSAGNTGAAGTGAGGDTGAGGTSGGGNTGAAGAGTGATGTGGSAAGASGAAGRGGATAGSGGATGPGTGGASGAAGAGRGGGAGTGPGGAGGGTAGRGGAGGGAAGRGGSGGGASGGSAAGSGGSNPTGGSGGGPPVMLDCGPNGWAVEAHGPPANRINHVVFADGYNSSEIASGGLLEQHVNRAMTRRFSENAQPFLRYRNFVNICVIKVASQGRPGSGNSMFGCACSGDRVASCNMTAINNYANAMLPRTLTIDWRAVVMNESQWCNVANGPTLMIWAGAHTDGPGAALHEGGHVFNQLADEYSDCIGTSCGSNTNGTGSTYTANAEVNSCGNPMTTDGKWDKWIGYNRTGFTGLQGTWSHSRYVANQYRPSANSMMNSLYCNNSNQATCVGNTAFNSVSREQIAMSIWKKVRPIDSTEPAAGAVASPTVLRVNVVDPAVISVDWDVDGTVMKNGGPTFDTSALGAGSHTIRATAYDNAGDDLVRYRDSTCPSSVTGYYCHRTAWKNSTQTVMWTFTK